LDKCPKKGKLDELYASTQQRKPEGGDALTDRRALERRTPKGRTILRLTYQRGPQGKRAERRGNREDPQKRAKACETPNVLDSKNLVKGTRSIGTQWSREGRSPRFMRRRETEFATQTEETRGRDQSGETGTQPLEKE